MSFMTLAQSKRFVAYGLLATLALACGSKKKSSSGGDEAQPEVSANLSAVQNGDRVIIQADSNTDGARVLCQIEVNGEKSDWQVCPTSVVLKSGTTRITAKAVSKDGRESEVTEIREFRLDGDGAGTVEAQELKTVILNKAEVGEVVKTSTLTVTLGVAGGQVNAQDVRYEYKREFQSDFQRVRDQGSYTFYELENGKSYTLEVRAVLTKTNQVLASDSLAFKVELESDKPEGGALIDKSKPQGGTKPQVIQSMQIGSFYEFVVNEGQHVTEYATTKTFSDSLAFWRIDAASDPTYLGNYNCQGPNDRMVEGTSPGGDVYKYCMSTPPRDVYKWMTDLRIANNHLAVATDADLIDKENNVNISINVFDRDYEFMFGRSRFEQLCLNQRGAIQRIPGIAMTTGFWGMPVLADFYMCTTDLVMGSGSFRLPSRNPQMWRNTYWVGAFFITSKGLALPQYECFTHDWKTDLGYLDSGKVLGYQPQFCGEFANPSLLEVTMISKTPYPTAAHFAREAQAMFQQQLRPIAPVQSNGPYFGPQ